MRKIEKIAMLAFICLAPSEKLCEQQWIHEQYEQQKYYVAPAYKEPAYPVYQEPPAPSPIYNPYSPPDTGSVYIDKYDYQIK